MPIRTHDGPAKYLALGDSYTICTGASSTAHRWPNLIAHRLETHLGRGVTVTNLGVGGYTTSDLTAHQLPHLNDAAWDYVSVLIGVNDFFQGFGHLRYQSRLIPIYDAIAAVPAARVIAVSIPDYSYTPVGRSSGHTQSIADGLRIFNAIARLAAEVRGFTWVDIFDASRAQRGVPGWIADDGLHPGDIQYLAWTDHIWSVLRS